MCVLKNILSQLEIGINIEAEHKGTWEKLQAGEIKTAEEMYKSIAEDHIKENKQEGKMKKKINKEVIDIFDNRLTINNITYERRNEKDWALILHENIPYTVTDKENNYLENIYQKYNNDIINEK